MSNITIRVLKKKEVAEILGRSHNTIERWVRNGIFPQPIRFTPCSVGWLERDVINWINDKRAANVY
jgi:predicted DNA-binding transcriptional regulator AlpA